MDALHKEIISVMETCFSEDCAHDDVTSQALMGDSQLAQLILVADCELVMAGGAPLVATQETWSRGTQLESLANDGTLVAANTPLMQWQGDTRQLLAFERSVLNVLHIACAIATTAYRYCELVRESSMDVWDTRKTVPGLRYLSKYAVRMGGGRNHRAHLNGGIFIKDNHIAACGGVANAIRAVRHKNNEEFIIECDSYDDAVIAIDMEASWIILDNMDDETMAKVAAYNEGRCHLEASGNITKKRVGHLTHLPLHGISVGSMTLFPDKVSIAAHWNTA